MPDQHRSKRELELEVEQLHREIEQLRSSRGAAGNDGASSAVNRFFENSPDFCYVISRDGKILDVNQSALRFLGYASKSSVIGKPLIATVYPEYSRARARELFEKWRRTGRLRNEEIVAGGENGPAKAVLLSADSIEDEDGRIVCVLSVQRDISAVNEVRETLGKERDRAQLYLDVAGAMMVALDRGGKIELVNRKACEVLGRRADEIIGRSWFDTFVPQRLRGEVRQAFAGLTGGLLEPLEYYENPVVTATGEERIIAWHNALLTDDNGEITGTLSSGSDITERRKAEEELRASNQQLVAGEQQLRAANQQLEALLQQVRASEQQLSALNQQLRGSEQQLRAANQQLVVNEEALRSKDRWLRSIFRAAPIGIGVVRDRVFAEVNECVVKMTGYGREELIGKNARMLYCTQEEYERVGREKYGQMEERGTGTVETNWQTRDGRVLDILLSSTYLNPEDPAAGVTFTAMDVSERNRIAGELRKADRLESLGMLAGGIAHDFNNLLSGVFGYIDMALEFGTLGEESRRYLSRAMEAHKRARALTMQMLTFAKGGAPVQKVTTLSSLVREAAGLALSGANVRGEYVIDDDLAAAEIDEGQISQVINNIVLNARQAMPEGGTVRIKAHNVTVQEGDPVPLPSGAYLCLTIVDEGVGIPASYREKIFDPFFSTKQLGSGLGLATSYSIVQRHNGHIEVESEPGQGTTFRVYLPACGHSGSLSPGQEEDRKPAGGSGRILVMDDEDIILKMGAEVLCRLGYVVVTARDGAEAVELYTRAVEGGEGFDAAILDLTVSGGMGGLAAAEAIRKIDTDAACIVSSGYSEDPALISPKDYGFVDAVRKPYTVQELGEVLRRVTGA